MKFLFNGWPPLLHTIFAGCLAYVVLIAFLRISGKRTLAKMNAFDLVVTVSLGSTLATILLNQNVSLAQGAVALAMLIGLQFVISWSSVRARWFKKLVTGEPALLLYEGKCLPEALCQARVTMEEIQAAARSSGLATLNDVAAIVLETDGSFSVIPRGDSRDHLKVDGMRVPGKPSEDPVK